MQYINLTPHAIVLNNGQRFEPTGSIARVGTWFEEVDEDLICKQHFTVIENLPDPKMDTVYIVSGMVLSATRRYDVVAPATGHPLTKRNAQGHIISVPCFTR